MSTTALISLPSGKQARMLTYADVRRPWFVEYGTGGCMVARSRRGDASEVQRFPSQTPGVALVLDAADAESLAEQLNAFVSPIRPPGRRYIGVPTRDKE